MMSPEKLPKDIQAEIKEIDNAVKNLGKRVSELVNKLKLLKMLNNNSCGAQHP